MKNNLFLTKKEQKFALSLNLKHRAPVWSAIADLFLDVDVSIFYKSMAKILADSPYDTKTLHYIYKSEVAPVCYTNLILIGEWTGFCPKNLQASIIKSLYLKRYRVVRYCHFTVGYLYTLTTISDWKKILILIETLRKNQITNIEQNKSNN